MSKKHKELILEVQEIESMSCVPEDFYNDFSALPCFMQSEEIHLKLPKVLIILLESIAKNQNINVEVLIENWLNDKLKQYAGDNMLIKRSESKIEKVYNDKEDAYKDMEKEAKEEDENDEEEK